MDIAKLTADPELEKDGKWFVYDKDEGVSFLIAYIGSKRYTRKLTRLSLAARRGRAQRDLPAGIQEDVLMEAMIGTILLGWKGLDSNGAPYEFNDQNAKRLLMQSVEVRNFVQIEAGTLENFQNLPPGEEPAIDEEEVTGKVKETADKAELKSGSGVGAGILG